MFVNILFSLPGMCGRCSQHGTALCSATSRQTRRLCAFNTIIPNLLLPKLTQLSVPTSNCQWISSFLTDRLQLARLGKYTSSNPYNQHRISSGLCSLPTALVPVHERLHTKDPSVKLLKFADNTTLIGLIQDGDKSAYREEVKELAVWCNLNNLEFNMLKTVEMIVGSSGETPLLSSHLPSWTALWLQWKEMAPPSPRTLSGTIT